MARALKTGLSGRKLALLSLSLTIALHGLTINNAHAWGFKKSPDKTTEIPANALSETEKASESANKSSKSPSMDYLGPILIDPFTGPEAYGPDANGAKPDALTPEAAHADNAPTLKTPQAVQASGNSTPKSTTATPAAPKPITTVAPADQNAAQTNAQATVKPVNNAGIKAMPGAKPATSATAAKANTDKKANTALPIKTATTTAKTPAIAPSTKPIPLKPLSAMGSVVKKNPASSLSAAETLQPIKALPSVDPQSNPDAKAPRADALTLAVLDKQIANQLRDDEETQLKAISLLWQSAVERSDTIRYAIEQLSTRNPGAKGKEDSASFGKRVLGTISKLGGTAATVATGNPAGLIGTGVVEDMLAPSAADANRPKITDTDMLFLAQAVAKLQQDVIETYIDYLDAQKRLKLSEEARRTVGKHANSAEASLPRGFAVVVDSLVQTQQQQVAQAQADVQRARNNLLLIAGPTILDELEKLETATPEAT
ncbi:MAG: hypothetical protein VKJ06_06465 [Vampirovibrionales bacterium]|nr:hypothetical protein [Vampirovibrionales bacterium]